MKKILCTIAIALSACVAAFAGDNNKIIDKKVDVKAFEEIRLTGSDKIIYTQGEKVSVKIHGLKEDVEAVVITQNGKTLNVSRKSTVNNGMGWKSLFRIGNARDEDKLVIYVTSPDLVKVTLTGSGDFVAKGKVDTDNLDIRLTGSGDIDFDDIICDKIDANLQGSGDIELNNVESITAVYQVKGSGDLKVKQQRVKRTTLDLLGSGDINVDCKACDEVEASVMGSGDIVISGQYNKINKRVKGSGDIHERK